MPPRPALAEGKVRHVGDAIAIVVAETREKAIDASEQVFVDYEMLPAAVETDQSDATNACQIWSDAERNVCFDWEAGNKSDTDEAFSKAKQVVELDLVNNRVVPTSMETRGAIGSVESDGRLALHVSCQGVHIMRRILAAQIFNVEENQILIIHSSSICLSIELVYLLLYRY